MTIDEVVEYILHTPYNTNKAILTEMLKQLIKDNCDTEEPGVGNVIYDGGTET